MTKTSAELYGKGLNLDYCSATKTQILKNAAMKIMLKNDRLAMFCQTLKNWKC